MKSYENIIFHYILLNLQSAAILGYLNTRLNLKLYVCRLHDVTLRSNITFTSTHTFHLLRGSLHGFINFLSGSHHYHILHHLQLHTLPYSNYLPIYCAINKCLQVVLVKVQQYWTWDIHAICNKH